MAEFATKHKNVSKSQPWKEQTLSMPDWSLLPEELLHLISTYLENCFDVVHARSVCSSWRSSFPFPSYLLRTSYSLPAISEFNLESKDLCTLVKVPLFFFEVKTPHVAIASTSAYFLGGIGRDDHMKLLPSSLQCSVKVEIPGSDPTSINMLDCQILPLGHKYRMIGCNPQHYKVVAFLPLNKEGEFIVLLNFSSFLFMLRSAEMRWTQVKKITCGPCKNLVTFRGKFYASFLNGLIFVINPYSLEVTQLMPSVPLNKIKHLVRSRNDDELFMVWESIPTSGLSQSTCTVCRLDEEDQDGDDWVNPDLRDRVLFVGELGNISFSVKELPDDCGLTGDEILFTNESGNVIIEYAGTV